MGDQMNRLALCIGINDYPGTGSDLAGCVNDAGDWAKTLGGHGFEVSTLTDKKATGKGRKALMTGLIAELARAIEATED